MRIRYCLSESDADTTAGAGWLPISEDCRGVEDLLFATLHSFVTIPEQHAELYSNLHDDLRGVVQITWCLLLSVATT